MTPLALTSLLIGAALGLRLNVLALVPALAMGAIGVLGGGFAGWSALLAMAVFAAALQVGYLGGAAALLLVLDIPTQSADRNSAE